jgi:hypothetical protein
MALFDCRTGVYCYPDGFPANCHLSAEQNILAKTALLELIEKSTINRKLGKGEVEAMFEEGRWLNKCIRRKGLISQLTHNQIYLFLSEQATTLKCFKLLFIIQNGRPPFISCSK